MEATPHFVFFYCLINPGGKNIPERKRSQANPRTSWRGHTTVSDGRETPVEAERVGSSRNADFPDWTPPGSRRTF